MVTADGDLVAIDEWPDEGQCKKFFQSAPKMAEGLVDRLVAHLHHRIVWELTLQAPGDLVG
jgi:hypothetical protein